MIEIIKFIYQHPLNKNNKISAVIKFIKWQISSRLWSGAFVYPWINDSRLIVSNGMTGATGNIYVGLMEYEDMSFLLHYLEKDDLFYDIGSNVGVYTILASKVKKAKTISIEPLPATYQKLIDNIQINRLSNVVAENIGLSDQKSTLCFTTDKDTMNRVATSFDENTQEVVVDTLDNLTEKYGVPKMIKIDVEGYESNVLNGAEESLLDEKLEVIILELNGSGEKFGYSDDAIHHNLLNGGFNAFTYNPFERELIALEKYGTHNTIYIKEGALKEIKLKLKEAISFECHGMKV